MLISPPFLSTPQGNTESNDDYVARNMQGGTPGNGAYPVSFEFKWHNGIHLTAPNDLARAIADGTVKYIRQPRNSCQADDPLDYYRGWTSDGVVVIEHKTEIGESVEVTYYSVYQHLSAIADNVKGTQPIYRKDTVGRAGYIYGEPDKLHFEICCDTANLERLIGRSSGKLDTSRDGRTDALWGDMYFMLPAGTVILSTDMVAAQKAVNRTAAAAAKAQAKATDLAAKATQAQQAAAAAAQAAAAAPGNAALAQKKTQTANAAQAAQKAAADAQTKATKAQADATQAASDYARMRQAGPLASPQQPVSQPVPTYTTTETLFVGMTYERGNCTMTTYRESGEVVGSVQGAGYEYELYKEATDLYPECASAGYELLRFGRVVGPDALSPADAAHWRKIAYPGGGGWSPGGEGWVDLRPDAIKKFSDADFPHWRGWTLIDDDTKVDSRCDSNALKALVLNDGQSCLEYSEAANRLKNPQVQRKLRRTICKVPSEWDPTDIDTRWGWLKQDKPEEYSPLLNKCMTDEAFDKLKAHVQTLAFWDKAKMGTEPYWYFEPREFIAVFKKCGWLSLNEMAQLIPRKHGLTAAQQATIPWSRARATLDGTATTSLRHIDVNKMLRKYDFLTPSRQTAFFAQDYIETGFLTLIREGGKGAFNAAAPMTQYYTAFYGRGLMQLTWAGTYSEYGRYRNFADHGTGAYADNRITATSIHDWAAPTTNAQGGLIRDQRQWAPRFDPDIVASDLYNACDSAGFFWVSKHFLGTMNIHQLADDGITTESVGRMSILVNGGGFGYDQRQQYAGFVDRFLSDATATTQTGALSVTRQSIKHGHWITVGAPYNVTVNYTPQRP